MQRYKVKLCPDTDAKKDQYNEDLYLADNGKPWQYPMRDAIKKAMMFGGKIEKGNISAQGTCPKCQKENLEYPFGGTLQDDLFCYEFECKDCGLKGKELFELSFQYHTDMNGETI